MLGFHRAGCASLGGVELDAHAARTYAQNFHQGSSRDSLEFHAAPKDIIELEPSNLVRDFGHKHPLSSVDILVGGPPCPTFTRVGRAKLREVHDHPEAFKHDPRAQLYVPYLRFAEDLAPVAILMENVPDFLNWGGHNLAEEVCEVLEEMGYVCAYTLLSAANYGVPQMRDRFYLIAIHETVGAEVQFPLPHHKVDFPNGYFGSRQVALKNIPGADLFGSSHRYVETPTVQDHGAPAVTVEQALSDLPTITGHLDGTIRRGARRFDQPIAYREGARPSAYARVMREWPGFESDGLLLDHVTRSLSNRDHRLFRRMQPGDDYPRAHALAMKLFQAALLKLGLQGEESSTEYATLKKEYVPPYDPKKFPNKWRKMEPDKPARTLMAHLGKDSYTHIHYDDAQARVLSVREAARLQSFPDGFRFSGTMNPAFRQIGNAVPPLMALQLANEILLSLGAVIERSRTEAGSSLPTRTERRVAGKNS